MSVGAGNHQMCGPRVGVAYDPWADEKTAIRGGSGLSYEGTLYNPLSNSRWNPPFYSFIQEFNALGGDVNAIVYGPTVTVGGVAQCNMATTACTPSGAPVTFTGAGTNPGQGVGAQAIGNIQGYNSSDANFAVLTGIVFPQGIRDPYVLNYYVGFQREIVPKTTLEVNYVGTQGRNLFRAEQANRLPGDRLAAGGKGGGSLWPTLSRLGRRGLEPNYRRLRGWGNARKTWGKRLSGGLLPPASP